MGKVHQIYSSVRSNTLDVRRAEVKARLLTGTYTLQSNRANFNQYKVSPTCQLCKVDPETREHFLVTCSTLQDSRNIFLHKLKLVFNHSSEIDVVLRDPALGTQLLLDSSHPSVDQILQPSRQQTTQIELYSRELIFRLHQERTKLLIQ